MKKLSFFLIACSLFCTAIAQQKEDTKLTITPKKKQATTLPELEDSFRDPHEPIKNFKKLWKNATKTQKKDFLKRNNQNYLFKPLNRASNNKHISDRIMLIGAGITYEVLGFALIASMWKSSNQTVNLNKQYTKFIQNHCDNTTNQPPLPSYSTTNVLTSFVIPGYLTAGVGLIWSGCMDLLNKYKKSNAQGKKEFFKQRRKHISEM